MKASFVLCMLLLAGLLMATSFAQEVKDCPPRRGYITMASINWSNAGGGLREGRTTATDAASAEAFCNRNERCYAFNDMGYRMLEPPASFAGFYPYTELCTYLKARKH